MWSAAHLDVARNRHPPASVARPCAPRRVPASDAVAVLVFSPLCRPSPTPRSLSAPGGFARHGFLRVSVSLPCPSWVVLRILASSGFGVCVGWLFTKRQGAKAPLLPGSRAPWYYPLNTCPCRHRSGSTAPPNLLPLSPACVVMIPYPLVE